MADDLTQAREDIEDAVWARGVFAGSFGHIDDKQGHGKACARIFALLARVEALSTPEGLVAELRRTMAEMKPGTRLDVIDALSAGYCVQCGDAVKDECHCANDA